MSNIDEIRAALKRRREAAEAANTAEPVASENASTENFADTRAQEKLIQARDHIAIRVDPFSRRDVLSEASSQQLLALLDRLEATDPRPASSILWDAFRVEGETIVANQGDGAAIADALVPRGERSDLSHQERLDRIAVRNRDRTASITDLPRTQIVTAQPLEDAWRAFVENRLSYRQIAEALSVVAQAKYSSTAVGDAVHQLNEKGTLRGLFVYVKSDPKGFFKAVKDLHGIEATDAEQKAIIAGLEPLTGRANPLFQYKSDKPGPKANGRL